MGTDRWSSRSKRDCLTILYYVIKSNFSPKNSGKKILKKYFFKRLIIPHARTTRGTVNRGSNGGSPPRGKGGGFHEKILLNSFQ